MTKVGPKGKKTPRARVSKQFSANKSSGDGTAIIPELKIQTDTDVDTDRGPVAETKQRRNSKQRRRDRQPHGRRSSVKPPVHVEPEVGKGRLIIKNLWEVCCNETEAEIKELDSVLAKLGLPPVNYTKAKTFELTDYNIPPNINTCKSQDFLDFYIFPYLLPAIQALIQFARVNRVFQCRFCTFNALDFIVEYLYNNNPRYPARYQNPTEIFEIPFCKAWLQEHPRSPPPKWVLMTSEEAAVIIQRFIRGYVVRSRPDVQEMRQFWRDYRKDIEEERAIFRLSETFAHKDYEEIFGEMEDSLESPRHSVILDEEPSAGQINVHQTTHSDNCIYCQAFRNFLSTLPGEILQSYARVSSSENESPGGTGVDGRVSALGGDGLQDVELRSHGKGSKIALPSEGIGHSISKSVKPQQDKKSLSSVQKSKLKVVTQLKTTKK